MRARALTAMAAAVVLAVAIVVSLALGARPTSLATVWAALVDLDPSNPDQLIVRELRVSRTVIGVCAGAALAVAGALMQSLTRNPFADPGLLGINAGASFAVVAALSTGVATGFVAQVPIAFLGAGVAAVVVYAIGARGSAQGAPARLALAGVAFTALISSATYVLLLIDEATLDQYRLWVAGSLTGRRAEDVAALGVIIAIACAVALAASRRLQAIALGEEAARSLGVRTGALQALIVTLVTLLAAAATAAAGPIVFVGLAVPHVARALVGASIPWQVVVSALGGASLTLVCDVLGRIIAPPSEIGVGVTTAFVGGLLFALLARRMRAVDL